MTAAKFPKPRSAAKTLHVPAKTRDATLPWIVLALLVVPAAVYAPVRHYGFLGYDDPVYVSQNPRVTAGLTLDGFVWAWTGVHSATWHPLTTLSHMLDCQLFGLDAGAHHLGNLVLHVLNTLLLFGFLARVTARPWRSACVAALFALHPLHVESVAWIAERKDVLSGFFWMLTLWAYAAYARQPDARRYTWLLLAFTAALLSKPMVVTLPVILLLLDVWPLGRWPMGTEGAPQEHASAAPLPPASGARLLLEKVPLLVLAAATSAATIIAQRHAGALRSLAASSPAERLANAVVAYALYLVKMLWPNRLAVFYPYEPTLPAWQILGALALLIAVSGFVLWQARAHRYLFTGWLWYLVALVPVSGVVRVGGHALADRFTYLPLIGIFIMVAWGIPDLLAGWRHRTVAAATAAALALGACTVLTSRQLAVWADTQQLFTHALAVTRNNYIAHFMLGTALLEQGRRDEAYSHFEEAARIEPTYFNAEFNMGIILAARGEPAAAEQHYRAALRTNPDYPDAHNSLGLVLAAQGDSDGAIAQYEDALRLDPNFGAAHNNLAAALAKAGRNDEAIVHYTDAIRLSPRHPEPHLNLAVALHAAGRLPDAIDQYRAALQLNPGLVEARYRLASAYLQAGRAHEAETEIVEVLRLRPAWPPAQALLAQVRAQTGAPQQ